MKIKKAAPRTEDSGLRGAASKGMVASFFQTQPCLLPSSAAPPHSSPRPPLAGLRCPHRPKREKAGRERECGAQLVRPVSLPPAPGVRLPGLAQIGAGDPGEAPWFFLEYPARSETWGEGSNRAQGCPPPKPALLSPSRGFGEEAWLHLLGDLPGLGTRLRTSGLQGRKSRLWKGKTEEWECREPEPRDRETRKGGGRRWWEAK